MFHIHIIYHISFIHSSVDGHLGCFHALAIVNSATMIIGVHVSFQTMVFSGYMPRSRIAGFERDITLPTKVRLVKAIVFPVVMYECESWTVKKAEC